MSPSPAKPRNIMAQVLGSGTPVGGLWGANSKASISPPTLTVPRPLVTMENGLEKPPSGNAGRNEARGALACSGHARHWIADQRLVEDMVNLRDVRPTGVCPLAVVGNEIDRDGGRKGNRAAHTDLAV